MYRIVARENAAVCATAHPHGGGSATLCSVATVKLQEFHAKTLLARAGLPVPPYAVASTPAEARAQAAAYLEAGASAVVVKAQVLVGGRGKAGGVKLARSADEAQAAAEAILGMDIKGITVRRVLVAPGADIVRELYLAAVLDRTAQRIMLMGSAEGGVEIETLAEEDPDAIVQDPRPSAARACSRSRRARWPSAWGSATTSSRPRPSAPAWSRS